MLSGKTVQSALGTAGGAAEDAAGGICTYANRRVLADGKALPPKGACGEAGKYRADPPVPGGQAATRTAGGSGTAVFSIKLKVIAGEIGADAPEEGIPIRCLNPVKKEGTTP